MFARATNRSYTCLRCQYRLPVRKIGWKETQNITTRVRQRWQSSAANAAVEDDYGEEIHDPENQVSITYDRGSPLRWRRWQPTPTAEIGVEVLGKPGEILLLPTNRKKRAKKVRQSDEIHEEDAEGQDTPRDVEGQAQPRIHESLAAESKPTLMKEALENIERIWEEAKNTAVDGFLEREQWMKFYRALSTGFTKKQIERYLEENMSKSESAPGDGKFLLSSRSFTRSRAATEIMTNLWGFTNDMPAESTRMVSKSIKLGRGRRELILGVDKEWRRFNQHVSIRASSIAGDIEIAGPETWVNKAQNVFTSLKRRVREHSLVLPDCYSRTLDDQGSVSNVAARSMLLDLIEKHEITMTKRSGWTAYAFNADDLVKFERDLLLSQKRLSTSIEDDNSPALLSLLPIEDTAPMPVHRHMLASDGVAFHRYSHINGLGDIETAQTSIDMKGEAVRNLITDLKGQVYEKDTATTGFESTTDSTLHQHSVVVGQILRYNNELVNDGEAVATAPQTTFASTLPFLSQFLSAQEEVLQTDAIGKNKALISLTFTPLNIHTQPEILVEAITSASIDARDNFTIKSVKLAFPSNSAQVGIPTTPFDLEFSRRTILPIFELGGTVQESYAPFLGQLGAQLRSDAKSGKPAKRLEFNKLLDLDLDCLQSTDGTGTHKVEAKTRPASARYALDRVEVLERHLYRLHEQDEVLLEHKAYIPLDDSSTQVSRGCLNVIPAEAVSSAVVQQRDENFIKSALQVVKVLTGFVAEQTKQMNSKDVRQEKHKDQE